VRGSDNQVCMIKATHTRKNNWETNSQIITQIFSRKSLFALRTYQNCNNETPSVGRMKHVLTCSIRSMHIRKYDQNKASHANSNTNELSQPIFCLQEDPSEHNDTWNRPTIQEHHTGQGRVLISLHNCVNKKQVNLAYTQEKKRKLQFWRKKTPSLHSLVEGAYQCS